MKDCPLPVPISAPQCNYVPEKVEKIEMKNKKGQMVVRINGKGKWYPCEYNEETQSLSFWR